jgi:SAM-dependent methyltransferase
MTDSPISFKQRLLILPILGKVLRLLVAVKNSYRTQQGYFTLEERYLALEDRHLALEQHYLALDDRHLALEQKQAIELDLLNDSLNERQQLFKMNMARTLARKQDIIDDNIASVQQPLANDLDNLYIAFENQFRGSESEIREQQLKYLPFLEAIATNITDSLSVLDIGCGRGEWLALLTERGYLASGLDISQTMVDFCRLNGHDAEQGDALSYLAKQADSSLHVITAFHVIEHLSFEHMVALFDECLRALKPGGKIIFETPNPENLTVGAYTFYLDPTHLNPLPPVTVEFIARQRGFSCVDIYRYNPRPEVGEITPLVEHWFCSPVDFAVIAEK